MEFAFNLEKELLSAIARKNLDAVKLLITQGANLNNCDAVITALECLKKPGPCPEDPFFDYSLPEFNQSFEILKLLINKGADVNQKNEDGDTPLLIVVKCLWGEYDSSATMEVAKYLLDFGANPNLQDKYGNSAFSIALTDWRWWADLVKYILDRKIVDIDEQDRFGSTPLMRMVQANNLDMVKYLLNNGANVNATVHDCSVLLYAIASENSEIIQYVSDKGARIDIKNESMNTLLIYGCLVNNYIYVKHALENGADANVNGWPDKRDGFSTLYYAAKFSDIDIIRLLVQYGVKADELVVGTACSHGVINRGDLELLKYFLEKWPGINIEKLLEYAVKSSSMEIVTYLRNKLQHSPV